MNIKNKHDTLIELARKNPSPLVMGIINPTTQDCLESIVTSSNLGLIKPIIFGPKQIINQAAAQHNIDISTFSLVETEDAISATKQAIAYVNDHKLNSLMKGSVHSDKLLHLVVARESNLRTDRRISHAWVIDIPTYEKLMIFTDAAINILPNLKTKRDIIQNAIYLAKALGVDKPEVAIIAATESVLDYIPTTVDAVTLCNDAANGNIKGGILAGPMGFDLAVSLDAREAKNVKFTISHRPDIFLMPNLEAGNIAVKILDYLAFAQGSGIVLGAKIPIVLTSRSSTTRERVVSCALAKLCYERIKS